VICKIQQTFAHILPVEGLLHALLVTEVQKMTQSISADSLKCLTDSSGQENVGLQWDVRVLTFALNGAGVCIVVLGRSRPQ
jgi:hypothetical protein